MVLAHDAYFYFAHRLMHHPKIFKHVHLVHHKSTNPSPWAAYSFHPLEAIVEAGIFPLIVFTIPVHSLVLVLFLVFMITRNVLGHLGMEILPKWFVKNKFLNWNTTTTHHDMHHKNFHTNYGLYFTWWDNLLGTTDKEYIETFEEVTSRKKETTISEKAIKIAKSTSILILCLMANLNAQSPLGLWQIFDENNGEPLALIEISKNQQHLEGQIKKLFLQPHQGLDPVCANCSGDKKDQKVIGMDILWNFEKNGDEYKNGKIVDPESGEIYTSKLWLEDKNTLNVRGYAGPFNLFFRTQTWNLKKPDYDQNPITGIWKTIDDITGKARSLVQIYEKDGKLNGRILEIYLMDYEGEDPICISCEGEKKNQKIVGMNILGGFKKVGNKWISGDILDPGNGKIYDSILWMTNNETLNVRGYWGPFFRTQVWKRVDSLTLKD